MKFVCEHCGSKYNISDEKVRNKVLKIRCSKCGRIIEVREGVAPTTDGASSARAAAVEAVPERRSEAKKKGSALEDRFADSFRKPGRKEASGEGTPGLFDAVKKSAERMEKAEGDLVVWFVAIDGAPVGPISARRVHRHREAERVGDDSLVWKEGMPDWERLRNCKELVGQLAKLDLEMSVGAPAQPSAKAPETRKPKLGLFAAEEKAGHARGMSPLAGRSVGAITDRDDEPTLEPTTEPIHIEPAKGKPKRDDLSEDFSLGMESKVSSIEPIYPVQPRGPERWVKIASVGFFVVALGVLLFIVLSPGGTTEQKVVEKVVEKIIEVEKERIVYRDQPRMAGDRGEDGSEPDERSSEGEKRGDRPSTVKAASGGSGAPKQETPEERKKRLLAQMGATQGVAGQDLVGKTAGKDGSGASGGGSALTQKELTSVVNKNKGRLQICYEQAIKKGEAPEDRDVKVILSLSVGGSGMVKKVKVGGAGGQYSGLKDCLEKSVGKWMFPSSSGESAVEFPLLFTPK